MVLAHSSWGMHRGAQADEIREHAHAGAGSLGDTFFEEAGVRAIVLAFLAKNPSGGRVESVFTRTTHLVFFAVISPS